MQWKLYALHPDKGHMVELSVDGQTAGLLHCWEWLGPALVLGAKTFSLTHHRDYATIIAIINLMKKLFITIKLRYYGRNK